MTFIISLSNPQNLPYLETPHNCQFCSSQVKSAFADLPNSAKDKLSHLKTCVSFRKGQVIIHEGARPQGVYCIHKGKVKLYTLGTEGKEQIIKFFTDGQLIGYRSLLSDEPFSASATALEDTFACYIPKSSFFKVIEDNPKFSLELLKLSCHELGEAGKMITSLAQKNVKERLAEILLILRATFGEDEEGYLDISLSREEIANMVGTATESVIRLISELKKEGYITSKGKRIALADKRALQQIASIF
jgi:CRP/FNR family transcriptional regulator